MQKFSWFYPKFALMPLKILTKISSRNLKTVRNLFLLKSNFQKEAKSRKLKNYLVNHKFTVFHGSLGF